jgi:hypothetical protein
MNSLLENEGMAGKVQMIDIRLDAIQKLLVSSLL